MIGRATVSVLLAAVVLLGCNKEGVTTPTESTNISLSIKSEAPSQKIGGSNTLVIESAKVLLKNIKFHKFPSNDSSDVKVGPLAVTLSLLGSVNTLAATRVPAGLYDRVKFRLHKPEDVEPLPDAEFREGESGQLRYSVIARGTYNGSSFIYKSRENASQEIRLATPLAVSDNGTVNVTLVVDPQSWFTHSGQALDPRDPANAQAIDAAIKGSFSRGFRDNNKDGLPD